MALTVDVGFWALPKDIAIDEKTQRDRTTSRTPTACFEPHPSSPPAQEARGHIGTMKRTGRRIFAPVFQSSPSSWALLYTMALSLFISSASFQYSFNICRGCSISKWHGALPPIRRRTSATASWASPSPQFSVGEEVLLVDDDGATHNVGVVEQKRGGWYTVCLKRGSKTVKRRGSQLQKRSGSSELQPVTSTDDANNNPNGVDEASTKPTAKIVDLDSIMHSMQPKYWERNNIHIQSNATNEMVTADTIDQVTNCHSQYSRWLTFSDLHVMPSTLSTCIRVLDAVHDAALRANSGILFLGDFWHHRGFVRVDCLNAVLAALSKWTVPCIMMPGNHDQTDWRGLEHALSPLGNSYRVASPKTVGGDGPRELYPGPLIISHPTKFQGALFVPHMRDKLMMKSVLSSKEASSSSALFIHADVKGASMNDLIRSQHGLPASIFPADKHVYSGHFHKPHVVHAGKKNSSNRISIRYVGSPYQTSFSEAGQAKSLLLVDSHRQWQCIEEIPIDVGPRYHRLASVHGFLDSSVANFRPGDRVAVTVCQQQIEEMRIRARTEDTAADKSSFDIKLNELRDAGVAVEIRDKQPQTPDILAGISPARGDEVELEDLSPKATLKAYLDDEVENGELGEATAKMLLEKGVEVLGESNDGAANKSPTNDATVTELDIESVSVLGFGSFRQEAVYPLNNRGVVLLRGTNKDFGSDSNGVGKSTLAMASLWALAGSIDPRPTQDGKVTDVVNDLCKVAEVTLRGFINSKPFVVKRTKGTSSKASSLTFVLGNSDLTRQSSKDTQALINEHFSMESQKLTRTIFHGQHTIGGLLESSDAKLKEELSCLVSLEMWQQSASLARSKQRELRQKASELEGMLSLRGNDKKRAEEKSHGAGREMKRRERILEDERMAFLQKQPSPSMNSDAPDIEQAMDSVQIQLHECENEIKCFEEELSQYMNSANGELGELRSRLNEKTAAENVARGHLEACQRKHDTSMMELKSAERQLSQLQSEWNMNMSDEGVSLQLPMRKICHTCGQPITSSTVQNHVMKSMEEKLNTTSARLDEAKKSASAASLAYAEAKEDDKAKASMMRSCLENLHEAEASLTYETDGLRQKIKKARMLQSNLSSDFASLARRAKEISEFNLVKAQMQANLDRLNEALVSSVDRYKNCCSELEMIEANIAELQKEKEAAVGDASFNSLLADFFGPKGIQAFVLRNVVQALQYCSQAYLEDLSDGSLQLHMRVGPNDSIIKQAAVLNPDGTWRVRPLSSLSGGQWRRCSLSLSLGFIDLASKRGRLRSSLLVLDEPLTHLDSAGRKSVGRLLRKMLGKGSVTSNTLGAGFGLSTILVILQEIAAEEIEECFDQIDEVIKHDGESFVILDKNRDELLA